MAVLISPSVQLVGTGYTTTSYSIQGSIFNAEKADVDVVLTIKDSAGSNPLTNTNIFSGTVVNFEAVITNNQSDAEADKAITLTSMALTIPGTSTSGNDTVTMKFLDAKGYHGTSANPTTPIAVSEASGVFTITFPTDSAITVDELGKYYVKFNGMIDYTITTV